ncbi:hypothetical protein [Altererythrobacter sp. Root672]|uniref:hypothetical protein n=1 Tax=Altererythrobacter sp. Root672 TaxID=1736584 RepID=UPI000701D4E9|nr:hypothetical protein [Altererythrobacter sp. Root672]KRA83125.1 hypothetical protein ASD76_03370 [Altererythrobacter sp. Root672]
MRQIFRLILPVLVAGSLTLPPALLAQPRGPERATSRPQPPSQASKPGTTASGSNSTTTRSRTPSTNQPATPPVAVFAPTETSAATTRVARWVIDTNDNGSLPFIIIDKKAATVFVYDAKGKSLGETPALLGITDGDDSTPGVGSKTLAELGPAEKTTPAGRFVARIGPASTGQKVLWVDYDTSVALHAVVTGNKKERRLERLLSPTTSDNRITYGCINVPAHFYAQSVQPIFEKTGGIVYVLPDKKPLETVFPPLRGSRIAMQRVSF